MIQKFLFVVFVALFAVGCSEEPETKTYKIGMVPWAAYAPLNVADAKGFWADAGVKVEVVIFNSNTDLNAALVDGNIDIALDMIGSWVDLRLQGKPICVVGETDWSNGGDKIILKKFASVPSLKGQKLGVYLKLLSVNYFVEKFLQANGASLSDFVVEEVANPDTLSRRFIDSTYKIIANYDPAAAEAVNNGDGVVAATSKDYPGVIPEGFAMRTDKLAETSHADLVAIFDGWIKAVAWAYDPANAAEFYQILKTKTFAGLNLSDAALAVNLSQVKVHQKTDQLNANISGGSLNSYLNEILIFAKTHGFPSHTMTADEILENDALIEALQK